jgi:PAS domain S-box-containing protein
MKLLLEAGNAVFEGVQMRKDKTLLTVELHVRIIDLDGKKLVLSVARDISERKRAEESLRDSEEKFRNLAEESPNMIFMNRRGRVVYANKKCEEILGYTREDFYSPDFNFVSLCAPEYVEVMKSAYATNMRNEVVSPYEFVLVTRGGKRINVIIAVKLIEYAKERVMLGIITDITERKKTEEELSRMFDQLVLVNEKLGVVGKLTRHDVRNKLSAVTGYAYLLKKKHADQADVVESLGKMEQTIKEVEAIFDFAKMYEQLGVEELTYIDVGKAVDEASALFPDLIVKVNNDCHGLAVLGDSFLRQLFCNLIDNTRKYGKKTTTINVYYEKAESGELRLIYEDDGVGISAENKLKLFHEGFSTGGSTGFGLYLIKKMVKVYGWKIQEVGEPEKGAKFVLTIPRISQNGKRTFKLPNKTTPFSKPCRELPQQRKNNTTKQ